jgi:uncharacterized protein
LVLELLVIQPTARCNLDCRYCYVPDRSDPTRLPTELLELLFRAVNRCKLASGQKDLRVLWHAGEPLAAGLDFYREAFDLIDGILDKRFNARHSIQTNATLITPAWCDFFRGRNVRIGVSLDGPREIHDANRKTRAGTGSFDAAMRGVKVLRAHGMVTSVLCVLTSENITRPDELFEFFVESGFRRVAFNVEEIEGPNLRSSLVGNEGDFAGPREQYRAFMGRTLQLNAAHGWPLTIRELASIAQRMKDRRNDTSFVPAIAEQQSGAILTMTRDGAVYSWSPELASGLPGALDRFSLGNIRDVQSLDDLLTTSRAREIQSEIDLGVAACRRRCAYFGVCGGGSPGNKFYEEGSFAATQTLKCSLQTQELTEVVLGAFAYARPDGSDPWSLGGPAFC